MSNSALESAISALSPKLWYKCTETTGTTITNYGSATSCNLTLTGTYTLNNRTIITGDAQKYLQLNGGYAKSTGHGTLTVPMNYDWTISFIMEFISSMSGSNPYMFAVSSSGETEATNFQSSVGFDLTSSPIVYAPYTLWENGAGIDVFSTFQHALYTIAQGQLFSVGSSNKYMVTMVKNSTNKTVTYYLNGARIEAQLYELEPTGGTSADIYLGSQSDLRASQPSTIGQIFLCDSQLTPTQILNLAYQSGFSNTNTYTATAISSADLLHFGTYANTVSYLSASSTKRLSTTLDPHIDPTIINFDLVDNGFSV